MPMPKPLTIPFARDALSQFINEIPDTPQAGADPQLASWSEGFGPITMQPLTSGGKPPEGPDFNGILSAISEHIVYQNGGGIYTFSQEYVDKTGGYAKDSVLISDDGNALWVSLSDDNAENFNTAAPPTEWIEISSAGVEQQIQDILNSLALKADKTIQVIAGTGLSGGGNLQANRTLSVNYGTTEGTVAQGNDSRIVNSVQTSGDQTIEGTKTFSSFPVTPSAAPTEEYQAVNKKYVDDALYLQPSMTGSITLNGTTDNTVVMTDIVTELGLEIGDVIRIDTGAYNKLHTVESITDNSSIAVNYEHAGNRGNGSLKLPDFTGQANVTRVMKWFNAPIGVGQDWVDVNAFRTGTTVYTNQTGRMIFASVPVGASGPAKRVLVDGVDVAVLGTAGQSVYAKFLIPIPDKSSYNKSFSEDYSINIGPWVELR